MPAKGSKLMLGEREYIFNPKFYKNILVKKLGITLTYKECKEIILTSNKIIGESIVTEDDGYKLSNGLGYLCAGMYKPTRPMTDKKKSKELGKTVYHMNFHSLGLSPKVYWFRVGRIENARFHEVYRFKAYKELSQAVSQRVFQGHMYPEWTIHDFIEKGRLENLHNKKYRKEQKE